MHNSIVLRTAVCAAAVLLILPPVGLAVEPPRADFVVAPGGDDAGPGSAERPFATVSRARDAVRQRVAASGGLEKDITVLLRGGTYRVTEAIEFGPTDGGSSEFRVTYAAWPGEQPVVSGGRVISGFRDAGEGVWTAKIPAAARGKWAFRALFVNGSRAIRARHPNQGYLRVEQVGEDRRTNFRFAADDVPECRDVGAVELVFLHDWSVTRVPIKAIDHSTRTLTVQHQIGGPSRWAVMNWFEPHPRYFLENAAEYLDAPGEWFLDRTGGVLHYRPRPGETIDSVEVVAPAAGPLVVVRGDAESSRPVRNLHFVGLAFQHSGWAPPGGVYWGRQACTYWSPQTTAEGRSHDEADRAAVHFEAVEGCRFADGRIEHSGRSGLWFGSRCRNNTIERTVVADCGGNGIMIGEGQTRQVGGQPWWQAAPEEAASGNTVRGCLVEHCGRELFGAVGIWVGLAARTTVQASEVRHLPYTGVSVGWMWWNPRDRPEPRVTPCRQNVVADNHIHHVMLTLSDGGGIYTLGNQPDSALRGNLIHDVPANLGRAENNGMFLDQGTGSFVVENNVIYNVARSPFRFHKGWLNRVRNNHVVLAAGVPLVRYNDTVPERITVENNRTVDSAEHLGAAIEAALQRSAEFRAKPAQAQ